MIKICKYCGLEKEYEKIQQFAYHVSRCEQNPNLKETFKKVKNAGKNKRIERISLSLICKCGKEFSQKLTQSQIDGKRYNKFCSRSCANSRGERSEETKQKISLANSGVKLYTRTRNDSTPSVKGTCPLYHYVCTNNTCHKNFTSRYFSEKPTKYCSRKCKDTCVNYKQKLSRLAKERYDKNPDLHPNRRCNKIKETYPEKYLREYLENESIIFETQFKFKRYHIDFYIPKLNLCIEIDGERWHNRASEREIKRECLIKQKYNLIRFWAKPLVRGEYQQIIQNIIKNYNAV